MLFGRYSLSVAVGAGGFLAGFFYHKLPVKHQFIVFSAKPAIQNTGAIIPHDVERFPTAFSTIMKYGIPSYDSLQTREGFVLSYDRRNKVPNWVMEHLTLNTSVVGATASRKNSTFFEDKNVHKFFRASPKDYTGSGYHKGHLAAAANHKDSQDSLDDTFVVSNVAPQIPSLNQGTWKKLETHVRELVKEYRSVYVCSGPLYLPRKDHATNKKHVTYEMIGENNIAVPTHFFKVLVGEGEDNEFDMESYILPNNTVDSKLPLRNYLVPRDAIERAAGFLLFDHLPNSVLRRINGESAMSDGCNKELLGG